MLFMGNTDGIAAKGIYFDTYELSFIGETYINICHRWTVRIDERHMK